jgi:hypothetical protein
MGKVVLKLMCNMKQVGKHLRKDGKIDWKKTMPYVLKRLEEGAMCKTIAQELDMTQKTLAGGMGWWRKRGIDIPNMHYVAPEGHIRTRLQKGIRYREMKVNDKWIQLGRAEGQEHLKRIPTVKKEPVVIVPATKMIKRTKAMPSPKEPKKEIVKLPTKVVDLSKTKTVRVSKTTYIQVPIDVPDEVAIGRYREKYQR